MASIMSTLSSWLAAWGFGVAEMLPGVGRKVLLWAQGRRHSRGRLWHTLDDEDDDEEEGSQPGAAVPHRPTAGACPERSRRGGCATRGADWLAKMGRFWARGLTHFVWNIRQAGAEGLRWRTGRGESDQRGRLRQRYMMWLRGRQAWRGTNWASRPRRSKSAANWAGERKWTLPL